MFSKKSACLIFVILILSMGFVSAEDGDNQTQSPDDSDILADTIVINEEDDFRNITEKINGAKENDIVEFHGEHDLYTGVNIDKSITLRGIDNRSKICGAELDINSGDVIIKDLSFYWSADYTVIKAKNEKLTIINCTFERDTSIRFTGSDLTVTNCTFKNTATAIDFNGKNLKINSCSFVNTTHSAVYCYADTLTLANSNFTNCSGMFIDRTSQASIKNNRFRDTRYGHEIKNSKRITVRDNYLENGGFRFENNTKVTFKYNTLVNSGVSTTHDMDISDCDFISSTLSSNECRSLKNCRFTNITEDYTIFNAIDFMNCSFISNTFKYLMGGGGKVVNSTFINNTGEGIFYGLTNGGITVTSSRFIENRLNSHLVEFMESKYANVTDCQFINNTAGENLLFFYEIKDITLNRNVFAENRCKNIIEITYIDTHIGYSDPKTTSFEIKGNIFLGDDYKISLSTIIASDEYHSKSATKTNVADNFYGRNFKNRDEFGITGPVRISKSWANVNLEKTGDGYLVKFTSSDGEALDMPDCYLSLKDRKTGEMIVSNIPVKSGSAKFKWDGELSMDSVFILDCLGNIINKPEANITYTTRGSTYDDFKITLYVKNGTEVLKGQNIHYTIEAYRSDSTSESDEFYEKTDGEGKLVISQWRTYSDCEIDHYNVKILFANRDFSLSEVEISAIKPEKVTAELRVESIAFRYCQDISLPVELDEIQMLPKDTDRPLDDNTVLEYSIYKNKKRIYKTEIEVYAGKFKSYDKKIRTLDAGTYSITVRNLHGRYVSLEKSATVRVSKAKTAVKAPKVTNKKYFKVKVSDKTTKKPVKNTPLKLKIGKTTYNVKTDKKGVAKFATKNLKSGTYKVKITSGTDNYKISAKSKIIIKR